MAGREGGGDKSCGHWKPWVASELHYMCNGRLGDGEANVTNDAHSRKVV
jgi:hypothetical protein